MRYAIVVATALLGGCVPDVETDSGVLREPRILAVRGIPAEARPGAAVQFEALIANPDGQEGAASFSYCTEARAAHERGGVSQACLAGERLEPFAVAAEIPRNACALFGPNTPPSEEGQPARRPSDPDPTGGYFLPVQARDSSGQAPPSFGAQRIRCDLAGATREIFDAFEERYTANEHPAIAAAYVNAEAVHNQDQGQVLEVPATEVEVRVVVPEASFEPFVVYSANDSALFDETERLTVHWYASAGEFSALASDVDASTLAATARYSLQSGSRAQLWIVLRDSRGGMAWTTVRVSAP